MFKFAKQPQTLATKDLKKAPVDAKNQPESSADVDAFDPKALGVSLGAKAAECKSVGMPEQTEYQRILVRNNKKKIIKKAGDPVYNKVELPSSSPTTVKDLGDAWSKYTLMRPNGVTPNELTGPIPSTLVHALLGALGGRYIAAPVARMLFPEYDEDKINRMSTLIGGAGMAAVPAAMAYSAYNAGGAPALYNNWEKRKPASGDALADNNSRFSTSLASIAQARKAPPEQYDLAQNAAYDQYRRFIDTEGQEGLPMGAPIQFSQDGKPLKMASLLKEAVALAYRQPVNPNFLMPTIPVGTSMNTLDTAVYNHTISPSAAANWANVMNNAANSRPGFISGRSIADAAIGYGVGSILARGLGVVSTALLGFPPQQQQNLAFGGGIAGALYNVAEGILT